MSSKSKVLIVEDEVKIAQLLVDYLNLEGFNADVLHSGTHVVSQVKSEPYDAIILDRMLPETDGLTLCKQIRTFSNIPILMLTARVDEVDRLLGLNAGADDYVCKPFSVREVVARIQTILRRASSPLISEDSSVHQLTFDNICVDLERFQCFVDKEPIELTPVEFKLLKTLMTKPGVVFAREMLMQNAYEDGRIVSHRTIDSHMKNLRQKLTKNNQTSPVQAVYGVGYKLV